MHIGKHRAVRSCYLHIGIGKQRDDFSRIHCSLTKGDIPCLNIKAYICKVCFFFKGKWVCKNDLAAYNCHGLFNAKTVGKLKSCGNHTVNSSISTKRKAAANRSSVACHACIGIGKRIGAKRVLAGNTAYTVSVAYLKAYVERKCAYIKLSARIGIVLAVNR